MNIVFTMQSMSQIRRQTSIRFCIFRPQNRKSKFLENTKKSRKYAKITKIHKIHENFFMQKFFTFKVTNFQYDPRNS